MKWSIDKSHLPEYLKLTVSGGPTAEDYVRMWNEVLSLDEWERGTPVLKDITRRAPLGPSAHEIQSAVADLLDEHRSLIEESTIAIFASAASDIYNHDRILEYALRLRGSTMLIRTFENEKDAIDWLARMRR